jgi:hypothetical protein
MHEHVYAYPEAAKPRSCSRLSKPACGRTECGCRRSAERRSCGSAEASRCWCAEASSCWRTESPRCWRPEGRSSCRRLTKPAESARCWLLAEERHGVCVPLCTCVVLGRGVRSGRWGSDGGGRASKWMGGEGKRWKIASQLAPEHTQSNGTPPTHPITSTPPNPHLHTSNSRLRSPLLGNRRRLNLSLT